MFKIYEQRLNRDQQENFVEEIQKIVKEAPLLQPFFQNGTKFNLQLTNCGEKGWFSDEKGYHYEPNHPVTKKPWPKMPESFTKLAVELAAESGFGGFTPQSCLVNHYTGTGRLGLHQDKDELDLSHPIISVSLGDDCIFQFGGLKRSDPINSYKLRSGDCVVWGGDQRLAYHGIKKVIGGSSNLVPNGGRYNLTIRQVT